MAGPTDKERLTALETDMKHMSATLDEIDAKLDGLISLRDKGAGMFLLASALFGSGIVGAVTAMWHWWKG